MKVVKTETPESTIIIFEQCSTCDHEDTYEVVEEENACHA